MNGYWGVNKYKRLNIFVEKNKYFNFNKKNMKRIFDIIFVIIIIFIVGFMVLNTEILMKSYDFNLFGFAFSWAIVFYFLIIFLIYSLINWIFVRFVFVFWGSKENKLNQKILKLQEEVNVNQSELRAEVIKEIKSSFNNTISNYTENNKKFLEEKLENIDAELWKISAEIWYLKKDENGEIEVEIK